jgi:hypothetical protein
MTRAYAFRVVGRLVLLSALVVCLYLIRSNNIAPVANASVYCCYCYEQLTACIDACNRGEGGGYGCTSSCESCCRYESRYIPHCFATCQEPSAEPCDTTDQCPLGAVCSGSVCVSAC